MDTLCLVPLYLGAADTMLRPLAIRLRRAFRCRVTMHVPDFDPELAYDPGRGQYRSRLLLASLLSQMQGLGECDSGAARVLGVAGVDLFIPVLTFVFGEAQLGGHAALVSLYRLQPELYGLSKQPSRLLDRLAKEAIHELGHTRGLLHCHDNRCVMARSTYVEDIDLKREAFCRICAGQLTSSLSA